MKIIAFILFVLCLTACNLTVNKSVDAGVQGTTIVTTDVDAGIQEYDAGF